MIRTLKSVLLITAITSVVAGCRKKEWDEHYGRPDSLEPPIYEQLKSMGRFSSLLTLIDKAGYKETLDNGGYWTLFAPNDDALKAYLQKIGKNNADAISADSARMLVQYLLTYNAYTKDRLDDFQSTASGTAGWVPDAAFRRRTAYYTGFYKDTNANGQAVVAVANNRNSLPGAVAGGYVSTDYNNKYISYFTDTYFNTHRLSATDYKYFYPQSEYTGFNVAEANVLQKDIMAENGVIHEIDKMVTPQPSIDEYVRARPEYSSFWAILNRLKLNSTVQFVQNADASKRYGILKGGTDPVFVKVYSYLLSFSPNNENNRMTEENDGQKDCWTMFVPTNAAVDKYVKEVLCQSYKSLDEVPIQIIVDFLNAHMFPTAVWPTQFATTRNGAGEEARFDPNADVIDRRFLSNGIVYGTNKVQDANVFRTVYGKLYLNPGYQMMAHLLDVSGLKIKLTQPNVQSTLLLISDSAFKKAGYGYTASNDSWQYNGSTNGAYDRLNRIINTCVFMEPYRQTLGDLRGKGTVKAGDVGLEGEYIKFDNMDIVTAGLQDSSQVAHADSMKTALNGVVYYINKVPSFTSNTIGFHIMKLGQDPSSEFNYFWQYLSKSIIFNTTTNDILGLSGGFYTVFIPNNDAIVKAVNDGLLPGTGTAPNMVPNFNPSVAEDKQKVQNFIQYHILNNHTVIPDGDASGKFESVYKNDAGTPLEFTVYNQPNELYIIDNHGGISNVIINSSNNLSNRCVIHLIDSYLNYNPK